MEEYKINPENQNVPIKNLLSRIDSGFHLQEIYGDIDENDILNYNESIIIAPDYQREYRFSLEDESALVESVFIGIPIPPIFLATDKFKKARVSNVVDGQHRLRAFHRFRNDEFKLINLKLLKDFEGKKFSDLTLDQKSDFEGSTLQTIVFKDFPGIDFELEIFSRYNKGTKPLTPQEIRHAVYNSQLNDYVNGFTYNLYNSREPMSLYNAYNITKDRLQKKKVQEGIFVMLSIIEDGIDVNNDKSLVYAEEYMKKKSELEKSNPEAAEKDFVTTMKKFTDFNCMIERISEKVEYPFSKELYGISSRNYKFQISIAMILAGLFYIINQYDGILDKIKNSDKTLENLLNIIKISLESSYLEEPNYKGSSTNSKEVKELLDGLDVSILL